MEAIHPAITLFYADLDIAIATAERMEGLEAGSVHAAHMRWLVEGLSRARQMMDRAVVEAARGGNP